VGHLFSQPEDEEKEIKQKSIIKYSKWGTFPNLRIRKKKENRSPIASVPSGALFPT
jgi:hypothetical protein